MSPVERLRALASQFRDGAKSGGSVGEIMALIHCAKELEAVVTLLLAEERPQHDADCEAELTSHGYTQCRCDERAGICWCRKNPCECREDTCEQEARSVSGEGVEDADAGQAAVRGGHSGADERRGHGAGGHQAGDGRTDAGEDARGASETEHEVKPHGLPLPEPPDDILCCHGREIRCRECAVEYWREVTP